MNYQIELQFHKDVIMIKKALLVTALSLGFSGFAQAEFVQGDWLVEGDNLSTLDTRTGKEWLRLTETAGMTLDEVTSALGGELSGWNIAGVDDMIELAKSQLEIAGAPSPYWEASNLEFMTSEQGNTSLGLVSVEEEYAEAFSEAFGGSIIESYSNFAEHGVYGMYANDYKDKYGFFYSQYSNIKSSGLSLTTLTTPTLYTNGRDTVGWFLVNEGGVSLSSLSDPTINTPEGADSVTSDVSAPLSLGLFAFASMGLAGLRRKQK